MRSFFTIFFGAVLFLGLQNWCFAQNKPQKVNQLSTLSKTNAESAEVIARLEKAIPQVMKDGDVPGLSIALIRNGKVLWHHGRIFRFLCFTSKNFAFAVGALHS